MLAGFEGFSKCSRDARFQRLLNAGVLTADDVLHLNEGGVRDHALAGQLVENSIGYFQLPLGVATHFRIDGDDYVIPMAVEETSIIAALSKNAKWIRHQGEIITRVQGTCILGQIQWARVRDFQGFSAIFAANRQRLIDLANRDVAQSMVARGGGVEDMQLRHMQRPDGGTMVVAHVSMNTCDAMGANIINQVLEYLKKPLETLTDEPVSMCILSNLNDQKITTAQVIIRDIEPDLGQRLQDASMFAEMDPYRAATHNKGVMNGIDPVVIATGNDWRAVEAGVHAYACREGRYQAISRWRYEAGCLHGELAAPLVVGTVGGVTALHPTAKLCLRMMHITSSNQLSRVLAAVGLVQNLGALRALCTEGISQGHMKLHVDNLLLSAGATAAEMASLKKPLQDWLQLHGRVSMSDAMALLTKLRGALGTS